MNPLFKKSNEDQDPFNLPQDDNPQGEMLEPATQKTVAPKAAPRPEARLVEQERMASKGRPAPKKLNAAGAGAAPALVENNSFKAWFNGSKIVNKDGSPMMVFHGSNKTFDTFAKTKKYRAPASLLGFYFTSDPKLASQFGQYHWPKEDGKYRPGANVKPVYLSIKNPKYIDAYEWIRQTQSDAGVEQLKGQLEAWGYDGVVVNPLTDFTDFTGELHVAQIVAFHPNQIKSAISNTGEYSSENARITAASTKPDVKIVGRVVNALLLDKIATPFDACYKCKQPIQQGQMISEDGGMESHMTCPPAQGTQGQSRIMFPKGYQPRKPQMAPQQPRNPTMTPQYASTEKVNELFKKGAVPPPPPKPPSAHVVKAPAPRKPAPPHGTPNVGFPSDMQEIYLPHVEYPTGAPADFPGRVIPNPKGLVPTLDTAPPTPRPELNATHEMGVYRGDMKMNVENPPASNALIPQPREQ